MTTTHLINFKPQFVSLVERGRKRQTMRPRRKRPIEPGHTLKLYTGLRTKGARFLRSALCKSVTPVRLFAGAIAVDKESGRGAHLYNDTSHEALELAAADGFGSYREMYDFFVKLYGEQPIHLELIKW